MSIIYMSYTYTFLIYMHNYKFTCDLLDDIYSGTTYFALAQ